MKKLLLTLSICIAVVFTLTGCGEDYDVTLCDYKNISISQSEIDSEIEEIRSYYSEDSETYTEGTVKEEIRLISLMSERQTALHLKAELQMTRQLP